MRGWGVETREGGDHQIRNTLIPRKVNAVKQFRVYFTHCVKSVPILSCSGPYSV